MEEKERLEMLDYKQRREMELIREYRNRFPFNKDLTKGKILEILDSINHKFQPLIWHEGESYMNAAANTFTGSIEERIPDDCSSTFNLFPPFSGPKSEGFITFEPSKNKGFYVRTH